ncbi:glucan 1,3-beta-glucosidase [Thraustotheca clavata]|uniref:glucan endo-1,3-beta-D-glucosidase n=1 Tax=Thraustotheca clavata TaxID=74557 RepID=A0A0A7CLP6_9STRA|nr:secreted protein [Thraustotheca clavata]OQS07570.1 glucan 1,3-beta-glucosidase [Thraustotheca clavata]
MRSIAILLAAAIALFTVHTATALDQKLYGLNYTPRKGQDYMPLKKRCKNATEIDADLAKIHALTDRLRIYSLTDCNTAALVIPAAQRANLSIWVGLWVGPNNTVYAEEKAAFTSLVAKGLVNNNTLGVHVASEAIYRKDINVSQAITNYNEIKQILHDADVYIPVTVTDIADTYIAYPQLTKAVDIISANSFPFWENVVPEVASQSMYNRMYPLMLAAKKYNKKILISETGWATNGSSAGASVASSQAGVTWLNDFYFLAKTVSWDYYWYSSFDQPWRHVEGDNTTADVENYFGLYFNNGTLKPEFATLNFTQRVKIVTKMPVPKQSTAAPVAVATAAPSPVVTDASASPAPVVPSVPVVTASVASNGTNGTEPHKKSKILSILEALIRGWMF